MRFWNCVKEGRAALVNSWPDEVMAPKDNSSRGASDSCRSAAPSFVVPGCKTRWDEKQRLIGLKNGNAGTAHLVARLCAWFLYQSSGSKLRSSHRPRQLLSTGSVFRSMRVSICIIEAREQSSSVRARNAADG